MQGVAAVVLAAGGATRLGAPKGLLSREGETAIARIVRMARSQGCAPVVVVLGRAAHEVQARAGAGLADARVVVNPDPARGRTSSIKLGLSACLDTAPDAVLLWPVDHPGVEAATVGSLLGAWKKEQPGVARPVFGGRGGHPVVLSRAVAHEVLTLPDDAPLREVVARDPARVLDVTVTDAAVRANLDTPEEAARHGWRMP